MIPFFYSEEDSSDKMDRYWKQFENETGLLIQSQNYTIFGNRFPMYQGVNRFSLFYPGRTPREEAILIHIPIIMTDQNQGKVSFLLGYIYI